MADTYYKKPVNPVVKNMTPAQKLEAAIQLYKSAWSLKAAALRHFHPDWKEEVIQEKVKEIFKNARS